MGGSPSLVITPSDLDPDRPSRNVIERVLVDMLGSRVKREWFFRCGSVLKHNVVFFIGFRHDEEHEEREVVACGTIAVVQAEKLRNAGVGPSRGIPQNVVVSTCVPDGVVWSPKEIAAGAGVVEDILAVFHVADATPSWPWFTEAASEDELTLRRPLVVRLGDVPVVPSAGAPTELEFPEYKPGVQTPGYRSATLKDWANFQRVFL